MDIKELTEVRKQFRSKFGKQFENAALSNEGGILNERIVAKLSVQPPTAFLVQTYLEKIADQFEVDWKPVNKIAANKLAAPMAAPVGYSVQVAPGSGLAPRGPVPPPVEALPVSGSTVGGGQSDDVSEMGNTSSSILSGMGKAQLGSNKKFDDEDDDDDQNTGGDNIPVAEVMAATTVASSVGGEEPDIYIPPAPQNAKSDDVYIPPAPGAKTTGLDNDDDKFADLQARFNNLKR